jgi:signal transduction histidine kinase
MSHLLSVLKAGAEAPAFAPTPGVADIPELVEQARDAGTDVSYLAQDVARALPAGVSLALYRIVQEALTNVRKHAGPGATATVTLRYGPGEAVIRVADDGGDATGSSNVPRYRAQNSVMKNGLAGMRDRVCLYGSTVTAQPRSGGGFEVCARLPLPAAVPTASGVA